MANIKTLDDRLLIDLIERNKVSIVSVDNGWRHSCDGLAGIVYATWREAALAFAEHFLVRPEDSEEADPD